MLVKIIGSKSNKKLLVVFRFLIQFTFLLGKSKTGMSTSHTIPKISESGHNSLELGFDIPVHGAGNF
jgi:hypothetical protein